MFAWGLWVKIYNVEFFVSHRSFGIDELAISVWGSFVWNQEFGMFRSGPTLQDLRLLILSFRAALLLEARNPAVPGNQRRRKT